MIGRTIGIYRIERLLGAGGMGVVYLVERPSDGRRFALKMLLPALAADKELVSRFVGEARAASGVRHPHIVDVLEQGETEGESGKEHVFYYVMELLQGETLTERLRRGALPLDEAVSIASQCASALAAAHRLGIIHRDLKPANIYLVADPARPGDGPRDFVKIVDFGIARLLDPAINPAAAHRTRTGMILGTPAYMPPEQTMTRGVVDARSDVYSLGVVLYQMVAGRPPFAQRELVELVRAHRTQRPEPPSAQRPGTPAALDEIVLRALAKDPAERFQAMDDLAAALAALPREPLAGVPAPRHERPTSPARPAVRPDDDATVFRAPVSEMPTIHAGAAADAPTVHAVALADQPTVHLVAPDGDQAKKPA